jgi:hypothetical protein
MCATVRTADELERLWSRFPYCGHGLRLPRGSLDEVLRADALQRRRIYSYRLLFAGMLRSIAGAATTALD